MCFRKTFWICYKQGNGTAKDVLDVINHVQDEVKKQFGVDLHPEVRILGED